MNSDDKRFEDTYDSIAEEEAIEPLEAEGAAAIQSTMPGGDENKPPKSIFKAMTTHLSLLKGRVAELDTYLDNRGACQTVDDREIDTIELKAGWIETKFNKILTQWEEFLDTDYDEAEHTKAEPIYNECDELSSKVRDRADTFIHEKRSRTAQAASGQVVQTPEL